MTDDKAQLFLAVLTYATYGVTVEIERREDDRDQVEMR